MVLVGAYASGSHITGIKGVRELDGGDPDKVILSLRSEVYGFDTKMMSDTAIMALVLFVTRGQVDFDVIVDSLAT